MMAGEPIVAPIRDASYEVLADWLELVAFSNKFGVVRLDELDASMKKQNENEEYDADDGNVLMKAVSRNIGDEDAATEMFREKIENEIELRISANPGAYPFELSRHAEELVLVKDWTSEKHATYLACLIASHFPDDGLLDIERESSSIKKIIIKYRDRIFQIISTHALCGFVEGQAASIGWPRADKLTILETLNRAEKRGSGFVPKASPHPHAPRHAKDGGIDVIAWRSEKIPPPSVFYYGQVATGRNWTEKPALLYVNTFEKHYMDAHATSSFRRHMATLIPFRIDDDMEWENQHVTHGVILERTRIPKYANIGLDRANSGVETDEAENMRDVVAWNNEFRNMISP